MSASGYGPLDAVGSTQPRSPGARWRPGWLAVGVAAALVVVLVLIGVWVGWPDRDDSGVEWADPESVARAFVQRYAVHDPAVCELATSALSTTLRREGRCDGPVRGPTPQLAVLTSQTCGATHGFDTQVAPAGEFGKRFVSLGLERSGGNWFVRTVLPIQDCRILQPRTCDGG